MYMSMYVHTYKGMGEKFGYAVRCIWVKAQRFVWVFYVASNYYSEETKFYLLL